MNEFLALLVPYLLRILPGLLLGLLVIFLFRKEKDIRIFVYVMLFILLRDTMTPLRLWSFGKEGLFWIRIIDNPVFLLVFSFCCILVTISVYLADKPNKKLFTWKNGTTLSILLFGILGALTVTAPFTVIYRFVPLELRGGPVASGLIPYILFFTLSANLMEEGIFRGYVAGRLKDFTSPLKAGLLSGIVFAFCHIFLATTVTDVGWPLLLFTLWEGMIAGIVGSRYGVLSSTLTHGGAIFILTSGMI